MAVEFGPAIRVNTLNSGWVPTGGGEADEETPERRRETGDIHPVGRMGHPGDIAGAVVFLAGDGATGYSREQRDGSDPLPGTHSTGKRTSRFSSVSCPPYSQCSNASAYLISRPRSSP